MDSENRPIITLPIIMGEIIFASPVTQTTVGAAGAASALPATPSLYMKLIVGSTEYVMPLYAVS